MNEQNIFCVDIFISEKQRWMEEYSTAKVNGKNGVYFTATVNAEQKNILLKECRRRHIRTRWYEKCWSRSSNYREKFLRETKGPYVCSYCGKQLSVKYMVIDHIIPVAKTKKSPRARRKLIKKGIYDVNDIRNLTPSCSKCNKKKSDNIGLWPLRAKYGKYKGFRVAGKLIRIAIVIVIILILLNLLIFI